MRTSNQPAQSSRWPAVLFVSAGIVFFVSLVCPVTVVLTGSEPMLGMLALYYTTAIPLEGLWRCLTRGEWQRFYEVTPFLLGFMANFTLLTNYYAGQKLWRTHAIPLLLWSLCGLASGLMMPLVMDGFSGSVYENLYIGYWLWIASLVLVAAGWVSLVRNQQQLRNAAFRSDALAEATAQPRSGESN